MVRHSVVAGVPVVGFTDNFRVIGRVHTQQAPYVPSEEVLQVVLLVLNTAVPSDQLGLARSLVSGGVVADVLRTAHAVAVLVCADDGGATQRLLIES